MKERAEKQEPRYAERMEEALLSAEQGRFEQAIDTALCLLQSGELEADDHLAFVLLLVEWNGEMGAFMECRRLCGQAVEWGTKVFGARDPRVLFARSLELYWMCEVGYDVLAEHRFAALIRDVKDVLGTEHDLWWQVRANSAMPAYMQGRFKEAADIYREILADSAECLPCNDLRVLSVRDHYADMLFLDGQYAEALLVYSSILKTREQECGRKDRSVFQVRYNIARTRFASGDHVRALEDWICLVDDLEGSVGSGDDLTISCRCLLIAAALGSDQNAIAAEQCRRLIADPPSFFEAQDCEAFAKILTECERRQSVERSCVQ